MKLFFIILSSRVDNRFLIVHLCVWYALAGDISLQVKSLKWHYTYAWGKTSQKGQLTGTFDAILYGGQKGDGDKCFTIMTWDS